MTQTWIFNTVLLDIHSVCTQELPYRATMASAVYNSVSLSIAFKSLSKNIFDMKPPNDGPVFLFSFSLPSVIIFFCYNELVSMLSSQSK